MKLAVGILCFFIVLLNVFCFPNWWRRGTARRIGEGQHLEQKHDQGKMKKTVEDEDIQVPEKLFSTGLIPRQNSFCHRARMEFDKLCGLRSATDRMKLASFVTNCHLEVSGRPAFEWDPAEKLRDAESDYVHLVMQFLPLMSGACQKAGYQPFLAQLVTDTKSTDELRSRIIELQEATESLFSANRESSTFAKEYMTASADASKKLTEILKLSAAIKHANDDIDYQRESLRQEADTIKSELREFNKKSLLLFDSMFGRFDGFQSQMRNMADTVGQIHSDSRVTSMFLKEPLQAITNASVTELSQASSLRDSESDGTSPSFLSFRKLGLLKMLVLAPLKLSDRIRQLEKSSLVGPFARDIFSSVQLLLVLLSVYIAYVVLTAFTRIVEAAVHFATVLQPSQPILARFARLFRTRGQPQAQFYSQDMEQKLTEHISANISKALSSASMAEAFANVVRNEGIEKNVNLLLTRTSEIEVRILQVSQDVHLLHRAIQSSNRQFSVEQRSRTPTVVSALKSGGALEVRTSAASLVTTRSDAKEDSGTRHKIAPELSEVTICTIEDCSTNEQLEHSDDQSFRPVDRGESDTRDQSSGRSSKKTGITTPRRELKRRRSSRRKA